MTDRVLAARTQRGLRWRCRRGWHRWRLTLASKMEVDGRAEYRRSFRCPRCGATRHEVTGT